MSSFQTKRDRDAWGSIRGYVYQVDLTIQRWLELEEGEILELERGEDVDLIQKAMTSPDEEQARILEQIKVRETNITLRSSSVLEALASFHEHRVTNPDSNLSFRYFTNAGIGTEQGSPVPDRTPLLVIWELIRAGALVNLDEATALGYIRDFLSTTIKPEGLNQDTWDSFSKFILTANDGDFLQFIRKFELLTLQPDPADIRAQLRQKLMEKLNVTPERAEEIYSHLFLYVFKLLSTEGIKQLTTDELTTQLALPTLIASDRALLETLNRFLMRLDERLAALEEQVSQLEQQRTFELTPDEFQAACRAATSSLARRLINNQRIIPRAEARGRLNDFLSSMVRYSFVLGPSGAGKSIFMATEAERLLQAGWTVLIVRGGRFSLVETSNEIRREVPSHPASLEWHQVRELWDKDSSELRPFALMIEGIDEGDDEDIAVELLALHDSISDIPPEQFKVLISCKDIVWNRFIKNRVLPLYEDYHQIGQRTELGFFPIYISDFSPDELDQALELIGAGELLSPGQFGADINPHIATVRDLLKHPATFEHYADLHTSGELDPIQNLTWSSLIGQRLRRDLRRAARYCDSSPEDLLRLLERLAALGREAQSRDFILDLNLVNENIPELFSKSSDSTESPYRALIDNGVLVESISADSSPTVGFSITDAGAYLLSFTLARDAENKTDEEFVELISDWLKQAWDYSPLLDALLAWIDRLADRPRKRRLRLIIKAIVDDNPSRHSSLFSLMRPDVLATIFDLIKRKEVDYYSFYREAALGVRTSPASLAEIRKNLQDPNTEAKQLAVELAGVHQDAVSNYELINLLQDSDEHVRHNVYVSLSQMGRRGIEPLLEIANDASKPAELRGGCITAIRGIGFRNEQVTATLTRSIEEGLQSSPQLLKSALLAAAHLRDNSHITAAITALCHEDNDVVMAAGKYLAENPSPEAIDPINEALRPQVSPTGEMMERYFLPSQLITALIKADRVRAEPIVLELFSNALNGTGELTPFEAIQSVEKLNIASLPPLFLEAVVAQLESPPERNIIWRGSEMLGKKWTPDEINALAQKASELLEDGKDVAKLFVDAIYPNMHISDEFPLGNRLNRVRDLIGAAKAQAVNLIPEASRLLQFARELSAAELCNLLWVAADTRAENELISRYERSGAKTSRGWHERSSIIRALGTCGGRRGADLIFSHLRSGEDISIYLHQEALYPLALLGVVVPGELESLARDNTAPSHGRAASMLALAELDLQGNRTLLIDLAKDSNELMLQGYAVRLLGYTKGRDAIPLLVELLRTSEHSSIKSDAAQALGRLGAREYIDDIESFLEDGHNRRAVGALAVFQEESSLPLILNGVRTAPFEYRSSYLRALGCFWKYPDGKAAIAEEISRWTDGDSRLLDYQSPLIDSLAKSAPDFLLERVNRFYDDGYLNTNSRELLAMLLRHLFKEDAVDKVLLKETARRLVCDLHVPAREQAAHSLGFTGPDFCRQIFEELSDSAKSEWERACAFYSLGFWESEQGDIERGRYDEELLVRRATDEAVAMRHKRRDMRRHIEGFNSGGSLKRLSSYLCIKEHGILSTIWELDEAVADITLPRVFLRYLFDQMDQRLKNDFRKKQDEQNKFRDSRGTVRFD